MTDRNDKLVEAMRVATEGLDGEEMMGMATGIAAAAAHRIRTECDAREAYDALSSIIKVLSDIRWDMKKECVR